MSVEKFRELVASVSGKDGNTIGLDAADEIHKIYVGDGYLPVEPVQLQVLTDREIMDIGLNTPMTTGLFWAYVGERVAKAQVAKNSKEQLYRMKEVENGSERLHRQK